MVSVDAVGPFVVLFTDPYFAQVQAA
jgi:hypothetical protein